MFNDQSTGDVKFTCRRVAAAVSDLKIHGFALDGIHSGLTVTVNKKLIESVTSPCRDIVLVARVSLCLCLFVNKIAG